MALYPVNMPISRTRFAFCMLISDFKNWPEIAEYCVVIPNDINKKTHKQHIATAIKISCMKVYSVFCFFNLNNDSDNNHDDK